MKMIRLAVAAAGVVSVALLVGGRGVCEATGPADRTWRAASRRWWTPINAANSAGGGTLNLAHGCDYKLTSSPDDGENGLPADHDADHDQRQPGRPSTGRIRSATSRSTGRAGTCRLHERDDHRRARLRTIGGGIANLGRHGDAGSQLR